MEKTAYFTSHNIEEKVAEWYARKEIFQHRYERYPFEPADSALLIMDMQKYFLAESSHAFVPSAPAIIPGMKEIIDLFHKGGRPVIFTRHLSDDSPATMLNWWKDSTPGDDERSEIISSLDTTEGIILEKSTYDAFINTDLENILRSKEITDIVICGVMTHLCCESTARSAFNRNFNVFFPIDGTATYNESFHNATLLNLSHGFATITELRRLKEAFH
ncbi:MAG: isochorismatase family cysteine hydrolase [Candidatus Thermoplasmatota archaeon]|jgi:nicotinamidase-related amidase|nr:isochorismatase family cysteine hydrolase [Candidatus Thermoplasmatota archaeon]MDP7266427.1 isochorismatase family cysteine hydrolase [Candidatus Thermoplasmatota archaeon]